VCVILSTAEEISRKKIFTIEQTWAKHCDQSVFIVPEEIPGLKNSIVIPSLPHEDSKNLYPKMLKVWESVYSKFKDQGDWFLKADDDSFVVVPNFKNYVSSNFMDLEIPRYIGRRFRLNGNSSDLFNSGGASYASNAKALSMVVEQVSNRKNYLCSLLHGPEDAYLSLCLKSIGVLPEDTRDSLGRERFHPFKLDWYFSDSALDSSPWYELYSFNTDRYEACCSPQSISFHWLSAEEQRLYYFIFYNAHRNI
jgi:glycoprotein-N-acetylgalactosamine 3-beta-galactosyltransferase